MTQEETQYYNNLKDNPSINQYVFDKLFIVINGITMPKQGVTLQLINGIPIVTNAFTNVDVFGQLFPQGISAPSFQDVNSDGFTSLQTNSNLQDYSNQYAINSPFGSESIFATPLPSDYYTGYVEFLKILYKIGAPMPGKNEKSDTGIQLEQVLIQNNTSKSVFDYKKYINNNFETVNFWNYWDSNFSGKAILNKKVAFLDVEKVFFLDNGNGYARFNLYFPYNNDSNLSLNNFSIDYLENQAAIKIKELDIDGFIIILNNLYNSRRKEYVKKIYIKFINNYENQILNSPASLFFIADAPLELLVYLKEKTINTIFETLLNDVVNNDKEEIVLKLLEVLVNKEDFNADSFLNYLIAQPQQGNSLFLKLYNKMNDWGGENNFSKIIIKLTQIWTLSNFSKPENIIYKNYEPLPTILYTQKYILGFRNDSFSFKFDNGNHVIMTEQPSGFVGNVITTYIVKKILEKEYIYHPFQPVTLSQIDEKENEELKIENGVNIPAFYLKAFDDKGVFENFEKSVWLAIDGISLVTGVGNLAKLRYLIQTQKLAVVVLKTTFGVIEVLSTTLSVGLALCENSKNRDKFNKIREYLFWVQICTLGADVLSSRILIKKAKDAKEVLNEYRQTISNPKELDEIDEFGKHLDEVVDAERKLVNEFDGGKLISERLLRKRISNLLDEYKNFNLEVNFVDEVTNAKKLQDWNARNVLGSFNMGPPPKLYFRKQVTELTWQHEVWHLEDLKKMGSKKFYNTPNWKKEELVWERIWKTKDKWTEEELVDSYKYYKETAKDEIGKWYKVKELESLLEKPYYKYVRYKK